MSFVYKVHRTISVPVRFNRPVLQLNDYHILSRKSKNKSEVGFESDILGNI